MTSDNTVSSIGTVWDSHATTAQTSLDHFFAADGPQFLNNYYPAGDNTTFNYWWLAHVLDVRLDAYIRTGDQHWLEQALQTHANILERNGGSLYNDYFDDMLWNALAILRLHDATGDDRYLRLSQDLWQHVVDHGWNDVLGPSVAWRKQQLYYKNTPANGPFVILSARLAARTGEKPVLELGLAAYEWLTRILVRADGFVEDGINRNQDGRIDVQWRYTYNQALYIGAGVALTQATGSSTFRRQATLTALTAIQELADDGLFRTEGAGGDEGLFKGIYYRYLDTLLATLDPSSPPYTTLSTFVRRSTDALWAHCQVDDWLLAGDDWSGPAPSTVAYSTQLSAIMALEARAALERRELRIY
ncbi:glycoside hydrolase family 76 protein [Microlunatus ginsengisoli]|uniref:Glycoside hydrolase family 76 protein n=1 Tax=Microlunatus ginsengisoli TaxID=363863 RepID=A0ABP7ANF3_9ACTN